MHWAEFPTGELTAAKARGQEQNFYDLLAVITGLRAVTTKRRINKASGRTLLRNVFKGRWPVDDDIGDVTAGEALELDLLDAIAFVVQDRPRAVRKELRAYEPESRVRDIYYEKWPTNDVYVEDDEPEEEAVVEVEEPDEEEVIVEEEHDDEVDVSVEQLSEMSVGRAKREGLQWAIAEVTGLTEEGVGRLMGKSHGRTLVRNVFASHWPEDEAVQVDEPEEPEEELVEFVEEPEEVVEPESVEDVDEEVDDEDVEIIEITEDELGDWSVAKAKREHVIDLISQVTGFSEAVADKKLAKAHGRTLVRNVFEDKWPERREQSGDDEAPAKPAKPEQLSLPTDDTDEKSANGSSSVEADELASMTVAQVKKGKHWKAIAAVTGLTTPSVRRRIAKHGARVAVLSIFEDRWPGYAAAEAIEAEVEEPEAEVEQVAEPEADEMGPVQLGGLSVGRARREGREDEISRVVGLTVPTVKRRMEKVHGRTLVRKAFDSKWPAAVEDADADDGDPDPAPVPEKKGREPGPGWWRTLLNFVADKQRRRDHSSEVIDVLGDRFEVIEDLGEGDFGHSYVARDRNANGKVIVLKVAKEGVASSAKQLHKQLRARIELTNANICRCLETVELDDGTVALVMEHCGVSVQDIIDEFQAIPANIAVQVIRKASQGLNYAHQRNIFHGAISPHNVLINASGKVHVTDFVLPPGAAAVPDTPASLYAAPELSDDETGEAVTRASDQFSLARVLCAMLDGAPIKSKRYSFRARNDLTKQQNQAIKRAMYVKPNQRFATTDDFAQELRP